jgi:hypothetical protein
MKNTPSVAKPSADRRLSYLRLPRINRNRGRLKKNVSLSDKCRLPVCKSQSKHKPDHCALGPGVPLIDWLTWRPGLPGEGTPAFLPYGEVLLTELCEAY